MNKIVTFSILLASLSVAYYFFVFLPDREEEKLILQQQIQANRREELEQCYFLADNRYRETRKNLCLSLSREVDCLLHKDQENSIRNALKEMNSQCEEMYR